MLVTTLLGFLALSLGILITFYYRTQRQTWGPILGISASTLGVFSAFAEYAGFSSFAIILGGGLGLILIIVLGFLAFERDPRVLVLAGMPIITLLIIFVGLYSFPLTLTLLEYMAFSGAIISAYDYSNPDVTARVRSASGLLRAIVWVFFFIRGLVESIVERPSRSVIAMAYFAFIS